HLIGLGSQAPFPGKPLTHLWEGGSAARGDTVMPVLSEAVPLPFMIPARYPLSRGPMKSLVWRQYHYIKNGDGGEELYQIEDDPDAENNLAGSAAARAVLERLRACLDTVGRA